MSIWYHEVAYTNVMFRCEWCGTPHSMPSGEALGPHMLPITQGGRMAPWFPAQYKPLCAGLYRCWFDGLDGSLLLMWNGFYWSWGSARVDTRTLTKWQGSWA